MCESRAVPSGQVYRQLFDAQVQLSRCLLAGRRDAGTDCLSAEDSNTRCSSRGRQEAGGGDDDEEEVDDVIRLPDTVVVDRPSSDIIQRLTEKKRHTHEDALRRLDAELTTLAQVCEAQVRCVCGQVLSCLQGAELSLDALRDRMDHLDDVSLQQVCVLWQQVEQQVKMKKTRILELKLKLTESETQRTDQIRSVLQRHRLLLENIGFLLPPHVHTLLHNKATVLNQSLLANRRSAARLLLLLQEEVLQQEALLRLQWEENVAGWRRSRVGEVVGGFRSACGEAERPRLVSDQRLVDPTERRRDLIYRICSLAPPTCSTALVCDWFDQLTAVNQQIDGLHAELLQQLRCRYKETWEQRQAEVQRCKEALSALQLPEDEVNDIISSQLLTLIGQRQNQEEEQLAALDVCCDQVCVHALGLSRCVFVVMRALALLWETHSSRLARGEAALQQQLDALRRSQDRHVQRKKVRLDDLLAALRQESSEVTMTTSLDRTVLYLHDLTHSLSQCVSQQAAVLERLPSVSLDELVSYSRGLASFYRLDHAYTPVTMETRPTAPSPTDTSATPCLPPQTLSDCVAMETSVEAGKPTEKDAVPAAAAEDAAEDATEDALTEAASCLLELYDITSSVRFETSGGVAYSGPAFRSPAPPAAPALLQPLSLFPTELLTHTLTRTRTLVLDHLQQHFHAVLSSAVATVTDRKKAVSLEQEVHLQQLNTEYVHTHVCQPRLAELQRHLQAVQQHGEQVQQVLQRCRTQLSDLIAAISSRNQDFTAALAVTEETLRTPPSSHRLQAVSVDLQQQLDQLIRLNQSNESSFRHTMQLHMDGLRSSTAQLLSSFRLFSEGGDHAPQEVKQLKRRLAEETKHISETEEAICSQLDRFQSNSLRQVKEESLRVEEKLCSLRSEVTLMEKIQSEISSSQVHIKAQAAFSNQQQTEINSKLEQVRKMMENTQVCPDQVCCVLSSVSLDLERRCHYLDFQLEDDLTKSSEQVQSSPPAGLLERSRTGVDLLDDPVVGIIKSLNRFSLVQQRPAETRRPAGQSPAVRPPLRSAESVRPMKGGGRSIRTDKRFQVFGPKPKPEQSTRSFSSSVNSILWTTNDVLLLTAEDFYCSERHGRFQLLPDSLDQWADSVQQRLLGYQEQATSFLSSSREELAKQLSVFDDLLRSLPSVLISNHGRQQEAELLAAVGGVRRRMEEMVAASEQERLLNVRQLRACVGGGELQDVVRREQDRQETLQDAVCRSHLELQECVRVRGEEFVTSLASLTEQLFRQLDDKLLTPAETRAATPQLSGGGGSGGEDAAAEPRHRTWPGLPHLTPPPTVTTATTASLTTARCTLGHLAVIGQRDTAVKLFEQLFQSELLRSDDDKRRQLKEIHNWSAHWKQQTHTLTHNTL